MSLSSRKNIIEGHRKQREINRRLRVETVVPKTNLERDRLLSFSSFFSFHSK